MPTQDNSTAMMEEYARSFLKYIHLDMEDISTRFIRLGFHLREMQDLEYYRYVPLPSGEGCYDNFYALIQDRFGLNRSTVSRLVGINRKFCDGSMFLSDKWKGYSYSQLSELLIFKDEGGACRFSPDMTIKEIREEKRKLRIPGRQEEPCPPSSTVLCDITQDGPEPVQEEPHAPSPTVPNLCDAAQEKASFNPDWYYFRFLRCV